MARVPYRHPVPDDSPEVAELFRDVAGLRGAVSNLYAALANQPPALRAFLGMSKYVRDDADLPDKLRELAVVATAHVIQQPYELSKHTPIARKVGVTEEQLAAFPDWQSADVFDPLERAVVSYADQVSRGRDVDDATFAELQQRLPMGQLMDLIVTVAWYHFVGAILGPLHVDLD